jgi:general secretion pathway protein D
MILPTHLRVAAGRLGGWALCCALLAVASVAVQAQSDATPTQATEGQVQQPLEAVPGTPAAAGESSSAGASAGTPGIPVSGHAIEPAPAKRKLREAEAAYMAGAKKLERNDLNAAEQEFQRALKLDPENESYAIAISVTRQHRLTELVQQASRARQAGDQEKAGTLLAEARAIDPNDPLVVEHDGPFFVSNAPRQTVPASQAAQGERTGNAAMAPVADRSQILANSTGDEPWKAELPNLVGSIHLTPSAEKKDFHLRGSSAEVLRDVTAAYGIRGIVDNTVEPKTLRFDLEGVTYEQAIAALMTMSHVFAVPMDETSVLFARDDATDRQRLERQLEETISVPGLTNEQRNDLASVMRNIFDVKQATVQNGSGTIVVRAPEDVLRPMNRTLQDLIDASGEVMVEVKLYEVNTTRMINAGATIPTAAGIYNVEAAATQLVNANQTLVQEAIAQGLITGSESNIFIAGALLATGLVNSSLLSTTIGVFGKGVTQTGITETGSVAFNLGQNSSDTRSLDDVQLRIGDRQAGTFRLGTRYPIVSSTYTTGISTANTSLGNASVNGVSLSSLLSQFAGGSSATIPQVTYEDLGVTLKATPRIERTGRINLLLDLKIEALSGSSANGNPVLENRQFSSDLTVADGDSVMMASSVTRSETAAMSGIPGLSELPGFQMPIDNNTEKDTSQLVVVVTPHLVRHRADFLAGPRIPVVPTQAAN